jgi:uncharacterized protein YidB (DUF937 family)
MAINIKEVVGELADRFRQGGQGSAIDTWVENGPNTKINETQHENALGPVLIDGFVPQTGLSRDTLLSRLALVLPETVDKLTSEGRLPALNQRVGGSSPTAHIKATA